MNWLDKLLAATIDALAAGLNFVLGIQNIDQLVFNYGQQQPGLFFGLFNEGEFNLVRQVNSAFLGLFFACLVFLVVWTGLRIMRSAGNPQVRTQAATWVQNLVLSAITATGSMILVQLLLMVNQAMLDFLRDFVLASTGRSSLDFWNLWYTGPANLRQALAKDALFAESITHLVRETILIYLNIIYLMRKASMILLVAIGSLIPLALNFESSRKIYTSWLAMVASTIFMQSVHGVLVSIYILTFYPSNGSPPPGILTQIVLLASLIPAASLLQSMLGQARNPVVGMAGMGMMLGMVALGGGITKAGHGIAGSLGWAAEGGQDGAVVSSKGAMTKGTNLGGAIGGKLGGAAGALFGGPAGMVIGRAVGAGMGRVIGGGGGMVKDGVWSFATAQGSFKERMGAMVDHAIGNEGHLLGRQKRAAIAEKAMRTVGTLVGGEGVGNAMGHTMEWLADRAIKKLANEKEIPKSVAPENFGDGTVFRQHITKEGASLLYADEGSGERLVGFRSRYSRPEQHDVITRKGPEDEYSRPIPVARNSTFPVGLDGYRYYSN